MENNNRVDFEFYSLEWTEYLLSQLEDHEKITINTTQYPTYDGLRRLCTKYIGCIENTNILNINLHNNSATVHVCMSCLLNKTTYYPVNIENTIAIALEDIATANTQNTQSPYSLHLASTAMTRAESRILRKLLGMAKVVAAEELIDVDNSNDDDMSKQLINDTQINVISTIGKRCNVDVIQVIEELDDKIDLKKINHDLAVKIIKKLNSLQQENKTPDYIGPYDPNWEKQCKN